MSAYRFTPPLKKGIVLSRPNRFIMSVKMENTVRLCHCPCTGRIGGLEFEQIPCLLSKHVNKKRKMEHTVEAISLDPPERKRKHWIGINQTRANHYLEFFLSSLQLPKLISSSPLQREISLNGSRIDFQAGNTLLEVKTSLMELPSRPHLKYRSYGPFVSFQRYIKQFKELSTFLKAQKNNRAIVLLCNFYNAKPFSIPALEGRETKLLEVTRAAISEGLEFWQANFNFNEKGIKLIKYFELDLFDN